MFRYWAMALEADNDEFGYTDASDIEIESEILEFGDEYEAPEPIFRRQVQAEFREIPPRSVPLSHPAVLEANTLPPPPSSSEGLLGIPSKLNVRRAETRQLPGTSQKVATPTKRDGLGAAQPRTNSVEVLQSASTKKPDSAAAKPAVGHRTSQAAVTSTPSPAPAKVTKSTKLPPALVKKKPAKEQIAPLSGKAKALDSKESVQATRPPQRAVSVAKTTPRDAAGKASPRKSATVPKPGGKAPTSARGSAIANPQVARAVTASKPVRVAVKTSAPLSKSAKPTAKQPQPSVKQPKSAIAAQRNAVTAAPARKVAARKQPATAPAVRKAASVAPVKQQKAATNKQPTKKTAAKPGTKKR